MFCPKCGSNNITVLSDNYTKRRSVGSWLFWILTSFLTFGIGLIFWFIMAVTNSRDKRGTKAICMNCHHEWKLN